MRYIRDTSLTQKQSVIKWGLYCELEREEDLDALKALKSLISDNETSEPQIRHRPLPLLEEVWCYSCGKMTPPPHFSQGHYNCSVCGNLLGFAVEGREGIWKWDKANLHSLVPVVRPKVTE